MEIRKNRRKLFKNLINHIENSQIQLQDDNNRIINLKLIEQTTNNAKCILLEEKINEKENEIKSAHEKYEIHSKNLVNKLKTKYEMKLANVENTIINLESKKQTENSLILEIKLKEIKEKIINDLSNYYNTKIIK